MKSNPCHDSWSLTVRIFEFRRISISILKPNRLIHEPHDMLTLKLKLKEKLNERLAFCVKFEFKFYASRNRFEKHSGTCVRVRACVRVACRLRAPCRYVM